MEFRAPELATPTYFQKPLTALNAHRGTLFRPADCQYLNYEGEITAIVGRPMRNGAREDTWSYLAGFAPANDVGCHDYRDTDAGSMLRVKGIDGFCPIGTGRFGSCFLDEGGRESALAPGTRMLEGLDRDERLRLMRFVCSFVWADLEVQSEERSFVSAMIRRLALDDREKRQVWEWLETPSDPDDVDLTQIPPEHRKLFVQCVEEVVGADADVSPEEGESLILFKELLR